MESLKQLVHILDRYKLRSAEVIGTSDKESNVNQFYDKIADNAFETDSDAATYFFDQSPNAKAYQKLKGDLKNRLINTLFIVDVKQSSYNERQKAYYQLHKDWAAVNILLGKNAWDAGIGLCQKVLKQSKKFEFTNLRMEALRLMRIYYGTRLGDYKKVEQISQELEEVEDLHRLESWCEGIYVRFSSKFVYNRATKAEISTAAKESIDEINSRVGEVDSYLISLYKLLIELLIYTSVNDHLGAATVCERAFKTFTNKAYVASVPLQVCYYQLIISYTQLGRYEEGKCFIEKSAGFTEAGSFNWFKYQELILLFYLHSGDYDKALKIFEGATQHRNYKRIPEGLKEMWYLFKAYFALLHKLELIKDTTSAGLEQFRKAKFFNQVPYMLKDKSGMGIPVLVLELAFLIIDKNQDILLDKIESVRKYCGRYLKSEDSRRSDYFFKMLMQIPKNSFNKNLIAKAAQKAKASLDGLSLKQANQPFEIEVIPYEKLWSILFNTLKENSRSLAAN